MKPTVKKKTIKTVKFCKDKDHDWQYMEISKAWYCTKCAKIDLDRYPLQENYGDFKGVHEKHLNEIKPESKIK